MQGEVDEQQPNEIISEFGYYPVEVNIETEQFSLRTLPGLIENVERINNDKSLLMVGYTLGIERYITLMVTHAQCLIVTEYSACPKRTH